MSTKDGHEKDPRQFDTRVVERNIQKGLVTRKDYEKYLKSLTDAKEKTRPPGAEPPPQTEPDDDDE
jgi:hypothetical protein